MAACYRRSRVANELEIVIARARRELPDVDVDVAAWRVHLEPRVTADNCESLHAGDLLLAFACAAGNAAALRIFEERHRAMLFEAVRTVDAANADDTLQELRRRLFLTDGSHGAPRILGYRGTGPLGGWLRVSALRLAIDLRRRGWREVPIEEALVPDDPERANAAGVARQQDQAVVRSALRDAVAAQPSRSRTLLRYYYSENVGVDELGSMYRVHASTISRWLATVRTEVFEETRRRLAVALQASPSDVESHLGLAHGLDVSLGSLLRTPGKPE